MLAYVIDVADAVHPPDEVFHAIQKELLHYDENLLRKPTVLIANKMDEEGAEKGVDLLRRSTTLPVIPASAKGNKNLEEVARVLRRACLQSDRL